MSAISVIYKEHTLGYIDSNYPDWIQILHSSILKGSTLGIYPSSIYKARVEDYRNANKKDFEEFRCSDYGWFE